MLKNKGKIELFKTYKNIKKQEKIRKTNIKTNKKHIAF
jgi:hypothetical protein